MKFSEQFKKKIQDKPITEHDDIQDELKSLLGGVLREIRENLKARPEDHLILNINSNTLKGPRTQRDTYNQKGFFTTGRKKNQNLTVESILTIIEKMLQSEEDFQLDKSLTLRVFHLPEQQYPKHLKGHRRLNKTMGNAFTYRHQKKSIVQIKNKDKMCLFRAVAVAILYKQLKKGCITELDLKNKIKLINRQDAYIPGL